MKIWRRKKKTELWNVNMKMKKHEKHEKGGYENYY
jgi:hypothetical protein